MSDPPRMLTGPRIQIVILGLLAAGFAVGGFQVGRHSVDAAALSNRAPGSRADAASLSSSHENLAENDLRHGRVREIATVPFSELYDVLRSASREQLMAWAADLETMPRGPRQRAAVAAYYKSLIQVDHRAAIEAVLHAQDLNMRDVAIVALMKAAPESIWGDLAEMIEHLPHPRRLHGYFPEDIMWNWSRVDPIAASQFIERNPTSGEDDRLYSLLRNWGEIDPAAAKDWMEQESSRQTKGALVAFLGAWAENDRAAAIDYAVLNAGHENFSDGINELAYSLLREAPDDARSLILRLPPDAAKMAMTKIASTTTAILIHPPEDYQRPPDVVARWMATLPLELWKDEIGDVVGSWMWHNADAATGWLRQLQPNVRDAALADYCRVGDSESTEKRFALGLTISDQKLRDEALGELARRLGTTRAEAIEAVDQLPVSNEQKTYLRKIMPEAVREH
jgi:hypothetical protein